MRESLCEDFRVKAYKEPPTTGFDRRKERCWAGVGSMGYLPEFKWFKLWVLGTARDAINLLTEPVH